MVNEYHSDEHQFKEFVDHRHRYGKVEVTLNEHHDSVDDEQSIEHSHLFAEHEIADKSDGRYAHHCNERAISTAQKIEYGNREKEKE